MGNRVKFHQDVEARKYWDYKILSCINLQNCCNFLNFRDKGLCTLKLVPVPVQEPDIVPSSDYWSSCLWGWCQLWPIFRWAHPDLAFSPFKIFLGGGTSVLQLEEIAFVGRVDRRLTSNKHISCPQQTLCQAQFQSSPSPVQLELRLAFSVIITTHPYPPLGK